MLSTTTAEHTELVTYIIRRENTKNTKHFVIES